MVYCQLTPPDCRLTPRERRRKLRTKGICAPELAGPLGVRGNQPGRPTSAKGVRVRLGNPKENGYSLIEALIVITIGLILTAMAIPMTQNALRIYRLNSASTNLSRMVQQTRYVAINQGQDACTLLAGSEFGIDPDCDGAFSANDIRVLVPLGVQVQQTSAISTTSMPFPSDPTPFTCGTFAARFNSRGSKTSVCGTATGMAVTNKLFVTDGTDTNAVTITGTGRARTWRWNGSAWQ